MNQYFLFVNIKQRKFEKLNINYKNIETKQQSHATYLGSILNETRSGESKALKVI